MTVVDWAGGMRFVGKGASGHEVVMDAAEPLGANSAARPVEALLCALGGCTGMDVVSILRKMNTEPKTLRVEIEDERAAEYPKVIRKLRLVYVVTGDVPPENLKKAIDLSLAKYCPIANTLAGVAKITYEARVDAA
ncbi:MAG: OsmC family protein [Thermotogota bacterium]